MGKNSPGPGFRRIEDEQVRAATREEPGEGGGSSSGSPL